MLKGYQEIRDALQAWLDLNNFNVTVNTLNTDFWYYPDDNLIDFSLVMGQSSIKEWNKLLEELGCQVDIDPFYTAFLHEVFHSITWDDVSDEDYDYSLAAKTIMDLFDADDIVEINQLYFYLPVEIIATRNMVYWMNAHFSEVKELYDMVQPTIENFFRINQVEE